MILLQLKNNKLKQLSFQPKTGCFINMVDEIIMSVAKNRPITPNPANSDYKWKNKPNNIIDMILPSIIIDHNGSQVILYLNKIIQFDTNDYRMIFKSKYERLSVISNGFQFEFID